MAKDKKTTKSAKILASSNSSKKDKSNAGKQLAKHKNEKH